MGNNDRDVEAVSVRPSGLYEGHTEETMYKVAVALREADLNDDQIDNAINAMQSHGILFRENFPPKLFAIPGEST